MKYVFENKVEFYITNVCNLTCDNCNRFNNHKFKGFQRWSDYADIYRRWSEFIDLKQIVIMGGEPLLNPTITDWIRGLSSTFGSGIQVLSNGLRLNNVEGLYDALLQSQGHVGISLHNINHFDQIQQSIHQFLGPITEELGQVIGRDQGQGIYYSARDKNNMLVNMYLVNSFSTAAVIARPNNYYTLHQSDPVIAHSKCGFVNYKCYHFIRGKLYKCGPVALFPEFDQQHRFDISEEDRILINSYRPLTVDAWPESGVKFMEDLDNVIPQCKFCPENPFNITISPAVKGNS